MNHIPYFLTAIFETGRIPKKSDIGLILSRQVNANIFVITVANLVFALRTKTKNEPISEINTFISEHRFDFGFCPAGEHKVCPYTVRWYYYICVSLMAMDYYFWFFRAITMP